MRALQHYDMEYTDTLADFVEHPKRTQMG